MFICLLLYLRFWNHTLICFCSMLERIGQSLMSCCLLEELGLGHSAYTLSKASTCSGVYLTYLPQSMSLFNTESLCIQSAITTNPKRSSIQKDTFFESSSSLPSSPREPPHSFIDVAPSTPLKIQTLNRVSRVKEEK